MQGRSLGGGTPAKPEQQTGWLTTLKLKWRFGGYRNEAVQSQSTGLEWPFQLLKEQIMNDPKIQMACHEHHLAAARHVAAATTTFKPSPNMKRAITTRR